MKMWRGWLKRKINIRKGKNIGKGRIFLKEKQREKRRGLEEKVLLHSRTTLSRLQLFENWPNFGKYALPLLSAQPFTTFSLTFK